MLCTLASFFQLVTFRSDLQKIPFLIGRFGVTRVRWSPRNAQGSQLSWLQHSNQWIGDLGYLLTLGFRLDFIGFLGNRQDLEWLVSIEFGVQGQTRRPHLGLLWGLGGALNLHPIWWYIYSPWTVVILSLMLPGWELTLVSFSLVFSTGSGLYNNNPIIFGFLKYLGAKLGSE